MFAFNFMCSAVGKALARFLTREDPDYVPVATTESDMLRSTLRPGDVLLVEGNTRIATAIKYLTQSTWSHAALCVGVVDSVAGDGPEPRVLIEADLVEGVRAVPVGFYAGMHTRICRPVGLSDRDIARVVDYAVASLGRRYDLKNVIDLMRYLLPTPPVPTRWRRRMLTLGSGEPTRAICSTLIAQTFQSLRYPILPLRIRSGGRPERLARRHYSLFVPRDFDISPYFRVVKPAIEQTFDYRALNWVDDDDGVAAASVDSAARAQRRNTRPGGHPPLPATDPADRAVAVATGPQARL